MIRLRFPFTRRSTPAFMSIFLLSVIVVFLLLVAHIAIGSVSLSLSDTVAGLFQLDTNTLANTLIWRLRLPRALIALIAGAMLGLSGAILQSILRNPLAEPGMIGATSGGVLMIVGWFSFVPVTEQSMSFLPLVALVGGLGTGGLVYLLNWRGKTDPVRLVLTGVVINAVVQSGTVLLLIFSRQLLDGLLLWLIGSLNGRTWLHWHMLWPWALFALPAGLIGAAGANILLLGDDVARGLGLRVELTRAALFLCAMILATSAVSVVGGIAFIGLIGPHIARLLVGTDCRFTFPLSAVLTAGLLLAADLVARVFLLKVPLLTSGSTLPVGAVTALLGAPFFLYLMMRSRK